MRVRLLILATLLVAPTSAQQQWGTWTLTPGSGEPAGSGNELQCRNTATTFKALTGSACSTADLTLGGRFSVNTNGAGDPEFQVSTSQTTIYTDGSAAISLSTDTITIDALSVLVNGAAPLTDFSTLALTGDVTSSGLATTIGADKVLESMLKAVDSPADEECLSYESTVGDFEWQSCGAGGGSPGGSGSELQIRAGASTFGAVTGSSSANGGVALVNQSAAAVPFSITGAASQSGNYFNVTSNGGSAGDIFKLDSTGSVLMTGNFFRLAPTTSGEWNMRKAGSGDYGSFYFQTGAVTKYKLQHPPDDTFIVGREASTGNVVFDSTAVVKFNDALRLTPRSSPPVTCGSANTAGVVYYDSDSNEVCACNGTAWTGLIAGGTCA